MVTTRRNKSTIDANGPLRGVKILDFTQALAGPFATQVLADLGADVIKVEPPEAGDISRLAGPFMAEDGEKKHSGYFHSINRNKRGMVVDLKTPEGRDIVLRLAKDVDVVVENFRCGVMERLGLSYETLSEGNPQLVYATVRGFGDPRTGASPYQTWPAYDVVAQAMGGMMGVTGPSPGQPTKIGPGVGDLVPALYLAIGIVSAVLHARETGRGQFVDVAMVDAVLAVCERIVHQHSFAGVTSGVEGNHHPFLVPFGIFPAKDGHVSLACPNDHFFRDLCRLLGAPELANQTKWATMAARGGNERLQLIGTISELTKGFTKAELMKMLGGKVPFGPIYDINEIMADPHFAARNMIVEISGNGLPRTARVAGAPIKFSSTASGVRHAAPSSGQHTGAVLEEAGFTPSQIAKLREVGAIK